MKNRGARIAALIGFMVTVIAVGAYHIQSNARTKKVVESDEVCIRDARLKAAREKVALLEHEATAQSNRADAAEANCRDEKEANEPLRKQIEKMIGEKIILTAELDKKKQEIQNIVQDSAGMTNTDLADLVSRLSDAEKEKTRLGDELEALRKELDERQPEEIEKADSRSDELNKIIEILEENKHPDENMDSPTNETEDVKVK